jgi:hypothetical protein
MHPDINNSVDFARGELNLVGIAARFDLFPATYLHNESVL